MKKEIERISRLVGKFNERFPVGSKVNWRSHSRLEYKEMTVKYKAIIQNGQAVCWFDEKSSCCSIEPEFVEYLTFVETKL